MLTPFRGRSCPASLDLSRRHAIVALGGLACMPPLRALAATAGFAPVALPAATHHLPMLAGPERALRPAPEGVTIIHFMATWCASCQQELASLSALHAALAGRPLTLLAVDSGEPEMRVRRFFEKNPVPFPVLLDEARAAMKAWDVITFPTTFLIAPGAAGALKLEGEADWADPAIRSRIAALFQPSGAGSAVSSKQQ